MTDRRISRRKLVAWASAIGAGALPAACGVAAGPTVTPAPVPNSAKPGAVAAPSESSKPAQAATVASTPAVTASTSKVSGEVVFWWHHPVHGEWVRDNINKAQSDIKAIFQLGEYDSNTKIMAALAAGNPPSMAYAGRWQGPELAVRNGIKALDDFVKEARTFKWDDLWERLRVDSTTWGKKWVVPYTTDTRALIYNKDVFADAGLDPEKPPTTWQQVQEYSTKVLKKDSAGRLDRIGFSPTFGNPPGFLMVYSIVWCMGANYVESDMKTIGYREVMPKALQFLRDLADSQGGYEAQVGFTRGLSLGAGLDAFSAGKVATALNLQGVIPNYERYAPNMKFGVVPGPVYPDKNINANYDGGGGLYLYKRGKNIDGGWAMVEWLMDPKNYIEYANQFNAMPATMKVGEEWGKTDKRRLPFLATAGTVKWCPVMVGVLQMANGLSTAFDNVMYGRKSIPEAVAELEKSDQGFLDAHNSYPVPEG